MYNLEAEICSLLLYQQKLMADIKEQFIIKGMCRIGRTELLTSRNTATPVNGLCLVLPLSAINKNGTEIQYHTQPVYIGVICNHALYNGGG